VRSRSAFFIIVSLTAAAAASPADEPASLENRTVVVGERFGHGGLHRWLWGADYRDLYTQPVVLPVLDLHRYADGLTVNRLLGHGETKALALKGANGRDYTFRPVIKDPTGLLPVDLRETFARKVLIDQMASGHPAGHVVAPGLLQAAGILHNEPHLVVMPDDPVLGQFRTDFANVVGDIEEWGGSPGFGGTTETVNGEEMWKRLRASPKVRADSRAYLKARLVDQLIGDWDRHRDQWRWGLVPGKERWQPIPEDRDQAFARFEGVFNAVLRPQLPLLVRFGPDYPGPEALTFDGWDVDKRILSDLDWPAWESVVAELSAELTDSAIEAAAHRLPPEYFALDGQRLIQGMKSRRNTLKAAARRFYTYINKDVDVFLTDAPERVEAQRQKNGDLDLAVFELSAEGVPSGQPYFHRRFEAAVTQEVRVYLYGGDDQVVVGGGHHDGVLLRVVAEQGKDVVDDSAGGGTRVSGTGATARVVDGPGTHWDTRPYPPPPPSKSADWIPAKDWGRVTGPLFQASYGTDYGVLIGGELNSTGYGFRKNPWADQQSLRLLYSTKQHSFRGTYLGQFRFENSPFRFVVGALGSGIEVSRYFGLGNDTPFQGSNDDIYKIEQDRFQIEPALVFSPNANTDISLGVTAKFDKTEPKSNPILAQQPVYGEGDFTQYGAVMRFRIDRTDRLALPRRGLYLIGAGTLYPALADVNETFGEVHGNARVYLSTKNERAITLSLHAGGQRVWGTHPFFESAFIGGKLAFNPFEVAGGSSVRGLPPQRYAGDASLHGGADLFLPLTKAFLLVPGQIGVLGFYDTGRVYLDGQPSNRWHHGAGGGLFFLTPGRHNIVSLSAGRSEGRTSFYLRAGFAF
jgi:hypothetical protein